MFADRTDAGVQLAARLTQYASATDAVVLGIPRGGVVVAAEVARELGLPLDVVLSAKIGHPANREYAVGAISEDGEVVAAPGELFSADELAAAAAPARAKLAHQRELLRGDRAPLDVRGRVAIVVDDGLATGLTAVAASRYLARREARRIVLAVPVAAASSLVAVAPEFYDVVAVETPTAFGAVGEFYCSFGQTSDAEVLEVLARMRA